MPRLAMIVSAGAMLLVSARAEAQAPADLPRPTDYYAAPGLYGTSYGYASYGVPRTHTSFSAKPWSPYYASLRPYGFAPGRFGAELWRPSSSGPALSDVYGVPTSGHSYRTFPVVSGTGLTVDQIAPPPPIGVYAPNFGPDMGLSGW